MDGGTAHNKVTFTHTPEHCSLARSLALEVGMSEREKSITQFNLSIFYKSLGGARGTHNII
jgi:hypothetical protein